MSPSPLTLMVAGTRSGSGKTTLTLCLMAALHKRGLTVQAFKAGPDFIDPGHHAALTGRSSCNLDTWMAGEQGVRSAWLRLLHSQPQPDMLLGEGVMGLFDGAGDAGSVRDAGSTLQPHGAGILGGPGSTAHLARLLHLPLLLVVDVRGMGQSAAAVAHGFTSLQPELNFAGIVCTHVGGPVHAALLREAFEAVLDQSIPLLGLMPRQGAPDLRSRHLGLVMAHELAWDQQCRDDMAHWLEQHLNVDALLERCATLGTEATPEAKLKPEQAEQCAIEHTSSLTQERSQKTIQKQAPFGMRRPRIGIARDPAFCFLYAHMPTVLQELGADCVFFSPLQDSSLPPQCDALYFPGGYPELHAEALALNTAMHKAVRAFAASGLRIYGECGGYIYLMESLKVQGKTWPMSGCLPLHSRLEDVRVALGYREVRLANAEHAGEEASTDLRGRGHEFHYSRLLEEAHTPPLWQMHDRKGQPLSTEGVRHGSVYASWVHLCPYGARELLAHIFQLHNPKENHAS